MDASSASARIHRAAVLGDRARRTAIVVRRVARFGPAIAAGAFAITLISVVLHGPRWLGLSLVAIAVALAGLAFALARTSGRIGDGVAAELDRAAGLGGAFRSACWFIAASPARVPETAWREFHVSETARLVTDVDWAAVYRSTVDRRTWLIVCALVVATLAAAGWPASAHRAPAARLAAEASPRDRATSEPTAQLATPALTEGLRAIKSGRVPSHESLAAVGHALDLAKADAATKSQLDELFRTTRPDLPAGAWNGPPQDDEGDVDERTQALANPYAMEWAYQDALSRAAASKASTRQAESASPRNDSVRPGSGDERREASAGKGSTDGAAVLGQARGQVAGFSSLLFGRQQADGAGTETSARGSTPSPRTAALTTALRQEIVRASSDIADVPPSGARRASQNELATVEPHPATTGVKYDRGRGSQPPVVPAERRAFVHDVFVRPAGDESHRPE